MPSPLNIVNVVLIAILAVAALTIQADHGTAITAPALVMK